jgi:hypothetical protein
LLFALCLKTGTYEELLQQNGAFADFLKTHSLLVGKGKVSKARYN